jgi:hypothetical protein
MADWLAGRLAGRLTGSQAASRNDEMKVIKAIIGIGTLMPPVRGFREGKQNNHLEGVLRGTYINDNTYFRHIFQAHIPGSQNVCRTLISCMHMYKHYQLMA